MKVSNGSSYRKSGSRGKGYFSNFTMDKGECEINFSIYICILKNEPQNTEFENHHQMNFLNSSYTFTYEILMRNLLCIYHQIEKLIHGSVLSNLSILAIHGLNLKKKKLF